MSALNVLTGRVFEQLTVIERKGSNARGRAMWRCACSCGEESIVLGSNLVSGHTTSCGCAAKGRLPAETTITQEFLNEQFSYDPESGSLTYRLRTAHMQPGESAGTVKNGRVVVYVAGGQFPATHLIWMMTYGRWPANVIDHINGDPLDDRLANLRDIDQRLNMQNRQRPQKNNKLGLAGVTFDKRRGNYRATITVNGKSKQLGAFATADEAHKAYIAAKIELHPGYAADPQAVREAVETVPA